jgi:hypothetical protein
MTGDGQVYLASQLPEIVGSRRSATRPVVVHREATRVAALLHFGLAF